MARYRVKIEINKLIKLAANGNINKTLSMRVFPYQKPRKKREAKRQTITEINVETRTTYDYYAHLTVAKQARSWSRALIPSPTLPPSLCSVLLL